MRTKHEVRKSTECSRPNIFERGESEAEPRGVSWTLIIKRNAKKEAPCSQEGFFFLYSYIKPLGKPPFRDNYVPNQSIVFPERNHYPAN